MNIIANSKKKKTIEVGQLFILCFCYHKYYYTTVNLGFLFEVFHVFILTRTTLTELKRLKEWRPNLWLQLESFKMIAL